MWQEFGPFSREVQQLSEEELSCIVDDSALQFITLVAENIRSYTVLQFITLVENISSITSRAQLVILLRMQCNQLNCWKSESLE